MKSGAKIRKIDLIKARGGGGKGGKGRGVSRHGFWYACASEDPKSNRIHIYGQLEKGSQ